MDNFTPRAQQVLQLARKEADRFNHGYVGTEHVLLGLIALGHGVAVNALQSVGIELDAVRMEVENRRSCHWINNGRTNVYDGSQSRCYVG